MHMKKIIGLALWLLAFLIPFRFAILDTDEVVQESGRADNTMGLINFVAMLALIFIGYALVDSASKQPSTEDHGH
jgi:hypothetical protein